VKNDQLITQLETYSNAIIGFVVLQALGYCLAFGTNEFFNCVVKTATFLALGLTVHFVAVTLISCYATLAIGRLLCRLSQANGEIVKRVFLAKCAAIGLFTLLPLVITFNYAVLDYPGKYECRVTKRAA
jgi:hypothetical protein